VRLRRVYLNCAGEDEADSTCIEYNSLAALPEAAAAVEQALIELLRGRRWDELYLPGMSAGATLARAVGTLGVSATQESPCHYVDLHAVRAGAGGYEAAMSAHCRKHIRRSQRYFERASGACVLHVAHTRAEAAAMLATLVELHEASWQRRGHAGAFASTSFLQFHRRLVESTFEQGRIMLAVLRAGDEPIGALYNFVYRGRVYVYQTGFIQPRDAQIRPGYLTHYLAVRHCLEAAPLAEYDFLAGDSIYKRSLATAARPLQWVTVRRRSFNALAFRALRWVKRRVRRLLRHARPAPPAGAAQ
jgi:CelD/BcsL family acetyltransferase involved in cellulose biosynthesis